jgi:phage baseplate assembly protein V
MNDRAFHKLAAPLARRLSNILARGVVVLSDAARKMQTLQVTLLAGETAAALEHFEPYGLTARPQPGAEVLALFVDGDRSHGVVIVAADRRYRLKGLAAGEVALYDDLGQKVHLTRAGIVIDGGGLPVTIQNAPSVDFDVPILRHQGTNIGKTHTHSGVQAGVGNSGPPV